MTLQWSPPFNTGGVELTGYIIEKRLATTHKWERVATVDTSVTLHTLENLKEKCQYYFRLVPCTTFFKFPFIALTVHSPKDVWAKTGFFSTWRC